MLCANFDSSLASCSLLFNEAKKEMLEFGCSISNSINTHVQKVIVQYSLFIKPLKYWDFIFTDKIHMHIHNITQLFVLSFYFVGLM